MTSEKHHSGLRAIAVFKAAKSLLAIAGAVWLCCVMGRDIHAMAVSATAFLHMAPEWQFTQYFIAKATHVSHGNFWVVIWTLSAYGIVHGAEAFGLWHELVWAEWFTLASGAIYLPLEIHSMWHGFTTVNVGAFVVSLIITGYIGGVLYQSRKRRRLAQDTIARQACIKA